MDSLDRSLRWLFVDLNAYFASVEQQERPELRGKPVAVVPAMTDSTCCIAISYEAKRFGIKTGTKVWQAKAMCPDLILVEGRHGIYTRYHHAIVDAVESCLHVTQVMSIDEMVCQLLGREREEEQARALAQHVRETIAKKVGSELRCSIGLAPNRFLAKVAGDMQKPNGLTVLSLKDLPGKLLSLKLRDLPGIGAKMEARLSSYGLTEISQLCALNERRMREVWGGVWGERYARWLRGEDLDEAPSEHRSIGHSHVLEPALRSMPEALKVARRLLSKAALRMRRDNYWTSGLSVGIRVGRGDHWEKRVKLPETQDTPLFLTTLDKLWSQLPPVRPQWVGVTLAPLIAAKDHHPDLFDDPQREHISLVMDRINERHGKNTAYFGSLFDSMDRAPTRIAFSRVPDLSEFDEQGD